MSSEEAVLDTMAVSLEICDRDNYLIALPARELVLPAACLNVETPSQAITRTKGGVVSLIFTSLLAMFPQLYNIIPGIDDLITCHRGLHDQFGNVIKWVPPEMPDFVTPENKNKVIKIAFGLVYHLVKRPQHNSLEEITEQFNELCATLPLLIQPPMVYMCPNLDFCTTSLWLTARAYDIQIIRGLFKLEALSSVGPTGKAFIAQVKLLATFAQMNPYRIMKEFIGEGLSHGAMLPGVGEEIQKFLEVESELIKKHTSVFPFIKVLRLSGHDSLSPVNFPNLYKVANTRRKKAELTFKGFHLTEESLPHLADQEVQEAVFKPPIRRRNPNIQDLEALKAVFGATEKEITHALKIETTPCEILKMLIWAILAKTEK